MDGFTGIAMGGTGSVWPAVDQDRGLVTAAALRGVWRRSLIEWADGSRDETTSVVWLQGISWYADLRQPVGAPSFAGVGCLRDLSEEHLAWLARQQGFAGRLSLAADGCFRWGHLVDLDVREEAPDSGWLSWDGDVLVEVGRYLPYREHWHRVPEPGPGRVAGVRLRDSCTGQAGLLVRAGSAFAYARGRAGAVAHRVPAEGLAELVRELDLQAAQDLVDCEVSLGEVGDGGWVISRSSLPYRVGSRLDAAPLPGGGFADRRGSSHGVARTSSTPTRHAGVQHAVTADVSPAGLPVTRTWQVMGVEGDVDALAAFTGG